MKPSKHDHTFDILKTSEACRWSALKSHRATCYAIFLQATLLFFAQRVCHKKKKLLHGTAICDKTAFGKYSQTWSSRWITTNESSFSYRRLLQLWWCWCAQCPKLLEGRLKLAAINASVREMALNNKKRWRIKVNGDLWRRCEFWTMLVAMKVNDKIHWLIANRRNVHPYLSSFYWLQIKTFQFQKQQEPSLTALKELQSASNELLMGFVTSTAV